MCGILGIIHREARSRQPIDDRLLSTLAHRGPDSTGTYTDDHAQLGHTRLSIIDLTNAGHQPMTSSNGRYVVTYNGEIYNYLEIKAELEYIGVKFNSHSDTEVLLAAYDHWGNDCVKHFRGPFAFVIWDTVNKVAFLGRDACGEKPLFYHLSTDSFTFASELKALIPLLPGKPNLNVASIDMYLHYQYVPEPHTLLEGVHKLPAGCTLTLAAREWGAKVARYWSVETVVDPKPVAHSPTIILGEIREAVEDAVKLTLRSDVPVGIALSGGIDSSAIAVLSQRNYPEPMHAFCVGYPGRPRYDEREQARGLAESLGMIVHEVELPVESFVSFFPELVRIMDEPIADPAAFGHYAVPREAADHGIKVLLSGIGGDEIFWGYPYTTRAVGMNQRLMDSPALRMMSKLAGSDMAQLFLYKLASSPYVAPDIRRWADDFRAMAYPHNATEQLLFSMLTYDFGDAFDLKQQVYGPAMACLRKANPFQPTNIGPRTRDQVPAAIIRKLFDTWLVSNCLSLGDRVSMAVGVETRMPFLDLKLIELVMAWRYNNPDHNLGQKAWLKAALKDVLPAEVLARPKAGFQPPVREWISAVVSEHAGILRDGKLVEAGVLDKTKLDFIIHEWPQTDWAAMYFVYKLVLLEMWFQQVVAP